MKKRHITYKQLLEIVSWGIFSMKMKRNSVSDKRLKKCVPIKGAIYNGIYVGSPGKDIYFMLPYMDKGQMREVAVLLSKSFPSIPPKSYGNISACIRFIYGQFEKQGVLKSEKDFKRMEEEKLDWTLPREFMWFLFEEFRENKNYYGLSMLHEMEGHRLGDEALIYKDKKKLKEMEQNYFLCIEFAKKCKGYKHLFSIYYWEAGYFKKFGNINKAISYFKLSILNAEKYYYKYFPNGDQYYSKRLLNAFQFVKENDSKNWKKFNNKCKKNIKGFL